MARIEYVPEKIEIVSRELIKSVADEYEDPKKREKELREQKRQQNQNFIVDDFPEISVQEFLDRNGIAYNGPEYDSKREMIWVGGGAGMAPLRAQIMHMLKTRNCRDREMHYFYGARAIDEVFFLEDFLALEKEFPNFHFHLALDRPDPKADSLGIKYTPGFIAPVMGDTYLKQHDAPEDIEYYLCGPPMMSKTVLDLLHSLGVEDDMIRFDDFGG
jgi:hypothetical protein